MPNSKIVLKNITEWKKYLEYSLNNELYNCSKSDKVQFAKKMIEALKMTLDDIRGKTDSRKFRALNSIPPELVPIDINLADGKRIILASVNPVSTIYHGILDDVKGNILHMAVKRKGEELPEDFLPPKRIITVSPPPPGFVRDPVFKREYVAKPGPCQSEPRPSTSEHGPSTSEHGPSTSEHGPSTSELEPTPSLPGPSTSVSEIQDQANISKQDHQVMATREKDH